MRPCLAVANSSGITYWKPSSFERRLSERNMPSCSEYPVDIFQNCSSVSCAGAGAALTVAVGVNPSAKVKLASRARLRKNMRSRSGSWCLMIAEYYHDAVGALYERPLLSVKTTDEK